MKPHKSPVTKKRASEAAHDNKRRDVITEQTQGSQPPEAPPSAAEPMLDLTKERTLTVKEASFRLGKSEDGIRKMLQRGALRGWQIGGPFCSILVSETSVEEVLIWSTIRFGK
jgi:excisionase family DNA binding protein